VYKPRFFTFITESGACETVASCIICTHNTLMCIVCANGFTLVGCAGESDIQAECNGLSLHVYDTAPTYLCDLCTLVADVASRR